MTNTIKDFFCSIISKEPELTERQEQELRMRALFDEKMRIIESRIHRLNQYYEPDFTPEEQIKLLEFYKHTILCSVEADMLDTITRRDDYGVSGTRVMPEYKVAGRGTVNANSKDVTVLVAPMNQNKILAAAEREDDFDPNVYYESLPIYFPELGVVSVSDGGRHSIAEAYVNREPCEIPVIIADTSDVWDKYVTDGSYWYDVKTGEEKMVFDYRLAVVFQIQKMIRALESK